MTTPTPQQPHPGQPYPGYAAQPQPYPPQYAGQPEPYGQSHEQPYGQSYEQPQPSYGQPQAQPFAQPVPEPEPPAAAAPAPVVRTGSPIIPPGFQPALVTAALALLTAGTAALGRPALVVAAVALQVVTAAGWFRLNGMWPARQGIALAFLAGVTADVALLLAPADRAPTVILGTLGAWIPLILVQQMRHRGSADERLSSLTATAASTVLTVLAAGYLAEGGHPHPVVVGVLAAGTATLVRGLLLSLPTVLSLLVALAAAVGSGFGTAHLTGMSSHSALLLALAAGVSALVGLRVASYDFPSRFVHFTAGVALPLALTAPVVWAVAHALGV